MKKILLFSALCLLSFLAKAQDSSPNFTPQQVQGFDSQVKGYVLDFFYYLRDLASSNTPRQDKPQLKKNLLGLFVGSAKIGVLSPSHKKKERIYPLPVYLDLVADYSERYKFVVLQFYKVMIDMKSLRDTVINGQHAFVGNYSYWQRFLVSNKDQTLSQNQEQPNKYTKQDFIRDGSDETKKVGEFYILSDNVGGNKAWAVLLGDINAKEIKSL